MRGVLPWSDIQAWPRAKYYLPIELENIVWASWIIADARAVAPYVDIHEMPGIANG